MSQANRFYIAAGAMGILSKRSLDAKTMILAHISIVYGNKRADYLKY